MVGDVSKMLWLTHASMSVGVICAIACSVALLKVLTAAVSIAAKYVTNKTIIRSRGTMEA